MSIWVLIAFIVGLILGLLIAWFYWRYRITERDNQIHRLQTLVQSKETNLLDLKARLQEGESGLGRLRAQLSQSEQTIRGLTAQVEDRGKTISRLETELGERDARIQDLERGVEEAKVMASFPTQEGELALSRAGTPLPGLAPVMPSQPDDLKLIEGIGPKIASLLQAAGISTFAQLVSTDVSRLQQILRDAHLEMADPTSWPEQARLAAAGDWEGLQVLQNALKGGRRA